MIETLRPLTLTRLLVEKGIFTKEEFLAEERDVQMGRILGTGGGGRRGEVKWNLVEGGRLKDEDKEERRVAPKQNDNNRN